MSLDVGIFLVRLFFGLAIAAHGAQKLFGWFGGYGLKGTGGFFEGIGFKPGGLFASAAGISEFLGGLLLVVGLFTPLGAAAVLTAMIVASVSVHLKNGFFVQSNGFELAFLYGAVSMGLIFTGAGSYSLDAELALGLLNAPTVKIGVLVASLIGAGLTLALRKQDKATTPAA